MIVPRHISDHLLAECLGNPVLHAELGRMCDSIGGRPAGGPAAALAEAWAHDLLAGWGLERVRYESFPIRAWTRGPLSVRALAPVEWPIIALAHGQCPGRAAVEAAVADLGHGEVDDYRAAGGVTAGAIVLCDEAVREGRRVLHRTEKLALAVEHGAAGLMILSSASGGLPRTGTCHRREAPIPSLGIGKEDGLRLRRLIAAGSTPTVRIEMSNGFHDALGRTVLAEIPGRSAPDEIVLAGAHLDSWDVAQGATDNGLGAAIVLEMARARAALPERPARTIRFALWAAEEIGLLGSAHYSATHEHELDRHVAVMNFDMTGDPHGYWSPGRPGPDPLLDGLAAQLAGIGMTSERNSKAALHSDHQAFMLAGVPVVGLQATLPGDAGRYYHSVGDTFEKVSLPALARAAAAGAHTAWAIADAPRRPWPRLSPTQVRRMIDEADLYGALYAEGYAGPPMTVDRSAAVEAALPETHEVTRR